MKYDAMIVSEAGGVPVIGGPLDGETRPVTASRQLCITFVRPMGIRHEWYELRTWARLVDGKVQYRDRWVYLGTGTQDGPPDTEPMPKEKTAEDS